MARVCRWALAGLAVVAFGGPVPQSLADDQGKQVQVDVVVAEVDWGKTGRDDFLRLVAFARGDADRQPPAAGRWQVGPCHGARAQGALGLLGKTHAARPLAEPTLRTLPGRPATFQSGGERPDGRLADGTCRVWLRPTAQKDGSLELELSFEHVALATETADGRAERTRKIATLQTRQAVPAGGSLLAVAPAGDGAAPGRGLVVLLTPSLVEPETEEPPAADPKTTPAARADAPGPLLPYDLELSVVDGGVRMQTTTPRQSSVSREVELQFPLPRRGEMKVSATGSGVRVDVREPGKPRLKLRAAGGLAFTADGRIELRGGVQGEVAAGGSPERIQCQTLRLDLKTGEVRACETATADAPGAAN